MLLQPALILLILPQSVFAAFNYNDRACWRRNCVVRRDTGTFCFEPQVSSLQQECANTFLSNLLQVHLKSAVGPSIVYYDEEAHMLGAATWSIPHDMTSSAFVCMTGQLQVDGRSQYQTVCREARGDDDMAIPAAHTRECVSDERPQHAGDGCFSLGKPPSSKDDDKEWYEQPALAGPFWLLGALVTLEKICIWAGSAARAVVALLPGFMDLLTAIFGLLILRWHLVIARLLVQQPAAIV